LISVRDFEQALNLTTLIPSSRSEWDIRTPDLNRPGMQFCGFYEFFAFERPQVIGKVEMAYLEEQAETARVEILNRYFSYPVPCVVICRSLTPPPDLLTIARAHDVPVYSSPLVTSKFVAMAIHYLNRSLAPHMTRHGVLLDVYGVGVFLSGKSGVGKSEAALELVKRGHQLVADDVVDICRISDDRLIGTCPEKVRHLMEIRGIGVIDVKAMYGIGAVAISKTIDLIIELETWDENKAYDRIGLQDDRIEIMGVRVPHQTMPIRPGRNLAIIVEVAARNFSLKRAGYNAARELTALIQDDSNDEINFKR
jgi:HPr kinase/phosphorylase